METDAWTTTQAEFTRKFLHQNPRRDELERQLRVNFDYEKVRSTAGAVYEMDFHDEWG